MWIVSAIVLSMLIIGSTMEYFSVQSHYAKKNLQMNGGFDSRSGIRSFVDKRGESVGFVGSLYRDNESEEKESAETVETVLVRTCRTLSTLAHAKKCDGWSKASVVWKFVGTTNSTGSLDQVWKGTTSSTFDCSSFEDGTYGRYLAQRTIPKSFAATGLKYDLSGVDNSNVDPCGYTGIIRK